MLLDHAVQGAVEAEGNVMDTGLWKTFLYRGLDVEGDVLKHPEYLPEVSEAGREFASAIRV